MSFLRIKEFLPTWQDYPDPNNIAISLYVYGCDNGCKGCHNPQLSKYIKEKTDVVEIYNQFIDVLSRNKTDLCVLTGGDPFYAPNIEGTVELISLLKQNNLKVCVYTGKEIEDIYKYLYTCLPNFVKTGKFLEEKRRPSVKTDEYLCLSSNNQTVFKLIGNSYEIVSKNGKYYF